MKLGSLFDGSGGFPLAGAIHGISPAWASEIEPYPIKVTKARFPGMKHLGSVLDVDGAEVEPVDIITFGSPCQDLSVAGKQAGLHKGERSNLFFEAIRIIKEMREATDGECPRVIVWENVPGAFSSNKGADITAVLDSIQGLGYVIDMNVLDAQNMGVPQRRRRIYLLGCSANYIARMKTITSWNIITQMFIEILLTILDARLNLSEKEPKSLVWSRKSLSEDGLKRTMRLFAIEESEAFSRLLKSWGETSLTYLSGLSKSEFPSAKSGSMKKTDTPNGESHKRMEAERLIGSISKSWQSILGETLSPMNLFTTLTATSETTESIIYGCASLLENMQRLIGLFKGCYQVSYETGLFISTGRKVCIDYARARQTSGTLFNLLERVHDWDAYLRQASETDKHFVGDIGAECEPEILPLKEGLRGDSAESGTAGEGTAGDAEGGPGRSCKCLTPDDVQSRRVYTEDGIWPSLYGGEGGGHGYVLRQSASGNAEGGPGGGVDAISECRGAFETYHENIKTCATLKQSDHKGPQVVCFKERAGKPGGGKGILCGDKPFTLSTLQDQSVCYAISGKQQSLVTTQDNANTLGANDYKEPQSVCYAAGFKAGQSKAGGIGWQKECAATLSAQASGTEPTVCYAVRTGQTGANGVGVAPDAHTLDCANAQAVAYSVDCRNYRTTKKHGTLQAKESGGQSLNYMGAVCYPVENHPNDSRVSIREDGIVPTLSSRMGTGGNNGPMVLTYRKTAHPRNADEGQGWEETDKADTLNVFDNSESRTPTAVVETTKPPRKYIIRRLTPLECCRLQGFPGIVKLEVGLMTRDEIMVMALVMGFVKVDYDTGKIYGNRGPGGMLTEYTEREGFLHPSGYKYTTININGIKKQCRVNRLVWTAAHGKIPDGYVIAHINNDKTDNRLSNLELLTPEQNSHNAKRDGLYLTGDDCPQSKVTVEQSKEIAEIWAFGGKSTIELAKMYGIGKSRVQQIVHEFAAWDGDVEGSDSARYKMWGNGIALPNATHVVGCAKRLIQGGNHED